MSIFHDPAVLMQKARQQLQEKTLTAAETEKKEEIVKSLKPKYGKTSKTYAIATSVAKKVAEDTENIDEKVGLSIVPARKPNYDRNKHGEVEINPANALRFAGDKLASAAGVKRKIRIRIGEDMESQAINHLIENGFAETEDNARNILRNMSETWLQSIMEREHDEPTESDDRPDVRRHNRDPRVRYRPRPRRPGPQLGRDYGGGSDDDRPPLRGFPRG